MYAPCITISSISLYMLLKLDSNYKQIFFLGNQNGFLSVGLC